jgi:hypothetical protein
MPYLSLTDFVDVVSKAGSPKATKVSQIKNREKYSPATDFYKTLREGIVNIHESDSSKAALKEILGGLTDKKKIANYPSAIDGYKKWWGNKALGWFNPPNAKFSKHGFDISVNPELGLEFNGKRHVVKLYLKDEKLTKFRVDLITGLMNLALSQPAGNGALMGILDARSAKLFTSSGGTASLEPMIDAELSYIAALWPHV